MDIVMNLSMEDLILLMMMCDKGLHYFTESSHENDYFQNVIPMMNERLYDMAGRLDFMCRHKKILEQLNRRAVA